MIWPEDIWNGNATTIRRGEFETEGPFAASNSFPLNTKIMVTNQRNGKSTTVFIRKRIPDSANMFLLLSETAARELDIGPYDVVNVEARVISYGVDEIIGLPDDLPYNPDPDYFRGTPVIKIQPTPTPAPPEIVVETIQPEPTPTEPCIEPTPTLCPCEEETPEPTLFPTEVPCPETPEPTPEPTTEPTPEETPSEIEAPTEEATAEPTPSETEEATPEPVPETTIEPEATAEQIGRVPEKNLYLLPHDDESFLALEYDKAQTGEPEDASKEMALKEAEVKKEVDKPIEGGISSGEKITEADKTKGTALAVPETESPQILDAPPSRAYEKEIELMAELPPVKKKESLAPEISSEVSRTEETVVALEPSEPLTPEKKISRPEVSEETQKIAESETDFFPEEPSIRVTKERGEIVDTGAFEVREKTMALSPEEPTVETRKKEVAVPTETTPRVKETEKEFLAEEPLVRDKTKKDVTEPVNGKTQITIETELALVPADPHPPIKKDTVVTGDATSLPKNSYFIQIGSYTDRAQALRMKEKYESIYPVIIFSPADSKLKVYKVLIGPLNKPESDTLYYRFRSNGFRDVFVKYIQ